MNSSEQKRSKEADEAGPQRQWLWIAVIAIFLLILLGILRKTGSGDHKDISALPGEHRGIEAASPSGTRRNTSPTRKSHSHSAEEIVAAKLAQFGKSRRELAHAVAKK